MTTTEEQFTVQGINDTITQAFEARRAVGRYTPEEAATFIHEQTGEPYEGIKSQLNDAVKKGELQTYSPGSFTKNYSKVYRDFFDHVYWNDLNEWLAKNVPHLNCQFPNPDAPKGEVRLSVTDQQNKAILKWLRDHGHDPLKLQRGEKGKSDVKTECRYAVGFSSQSVFNTAWDRLRSDGKIKDAK